MCLPLRSLHLGVLPREEALFEAAIHGERDEGQQPPVLQQSERSQEGLAERLPVLTELAGLLPVDVVQKYRHNEHGQQTHSCHATEGRRHGLLTRHSGPINLRELILVSLMTIDALKKSSGCRSDDRFNILL